MLDPEQIITIRIQDKVLDTTRSGSTTLYKFVGCTWIPLPEGPGRPASPPVHQVDTLQLIPAT